MDELKKIVIEIIPHDQQRYETCGDWQLDENGVMQVKVSNFGLEIENFMVAIHEVVELILLRHRGVTDKDIDKFDFEFEQRVKKGEAGRNDEPGFASDSPYIQEHTLATAVELQMCAVAKINWNEYSAKIEALFGDD